MVKSSFSLEKISAILKRKISKFHFDGGKCSENIKHGPSPNEGVSNYSKILLEFHDAIVGQVHNSVNM